MKFRLRNAIILALSLATFLEFDPASVMIN